MITKLKSLGMAGSLLVLALGLSSCQFQPLYASPDGATGPNSVALSQIYVAEVDTREAQQVRNHLIFLLSGGSSPLNPTHEVKLRVATSVRSLAAAVVSQESNQLGNTAGSVTAKGSYEIFDKTNNELIFRGTREASAAYDKTSQSFATQRAERDAANRAAKSLAEQIRLAIAADFNRT